MKSPCKDCFDRESLCHTFFPKYKEFQEKIEQRRKAKEDENNRYSTPKRSAKNQKLRLGIK